MIVLTVNGRTHELDLDPRMPLLWALRDHLGLTGTKYGCGTGHCGACLVHLDGEPTNACITTLEQVHGRSVTTIEGLSPDGRHPVQLAWIAVEVPQCGYCQPGQIMAAAALLASHPQPSEAEIEAAMSRVLCRCGTYSRIRQAIRRALNPETQEPKVD
jgi:isoquinoline 1-oxidoreductase alpha subunit